MLTEYSIFITALLHMYSVQREKLILMSVDIYRTIFDINDTHIVKATLETHTVMADDG